MSSPTPPPTTISDLLRYARSLLLDPALGPQVFPPAMGGSRLQEVRIVGGSDQFGERGGTMRWKPGSGGWPFGILTARKPRKDPWKETGRVWEDWQGMLVIGLTQQDNGSVDLTSWSNAWDAVITQLVVSHRRFGQVASNAGDIYWEYLESDGPRAIVYSGTTFVALVCRLNFHNVILAPWGI